VTVRRSRLTVRPMTPDDGAALDAVFAGMSPESRRMRYLRPIGRLSPSVRAALLDVDGDRHTAFVAEHGRRDRRRAVGIARYVVVDDDQHAEIAYEVADAWHGRGVGTLLLDRLLHTARRNGVRTVEASVLPDNAASLRLLRRALPDLRVTWRRDVLEARASLVDQPLSFAGLLDDLNGTVVAA
jgi:RimJ/RimL family protein N-acetyltransferase